MSQFYRIHTTATAPIAARDVLAQVEEHYGFIPNLMGVMASAPSLLKAYVTLSKLLAETSFSPVEQQLLLLTISIQNGCDYCAAAHSMAARFAGVPVDTVEAIRAGKTLKNAKLEALRRFVALVVATRGLPTQSEIDTFLSAGYDRDQILEVILAVGLKTLSNYTNHVAHTPLDAAFAQARLEKTA